jgi:hydrogenase maturation protein HypF
MRQGNQVFYRKIQLPFAVKRPILAFGSQTKNTACFAEGNSAYLSRPHSDLSSLLDFCKFEKDVEYFLKKNPKIIACDLHPEYQSTKFAQSLSPIPYPLSFIQHHHAHIASCMADNGLGNQKVIGVAFDGTGLGSDNTLWGAEFLICDYKNSKRAAKLKEIPLLGGERAILQPWRLTVLWLYQIYKERFLNLRIGFTEVIDKKKWQVLKNMYLSNFNSPLASSMGRLFDAVGSLVLAKPKVNFEAELAIQVERLAALHAARRPSQAAGYKFNIQRNGSTYIINPIPMFKQIIKDLKVKEPKEKIAYRFHLTVAQIIKRMCLILRKENNINRIVLSGGVFQNKLLRELSLDLLEREKFNVFTHKNLSCNDSGISLGQAAVANHRVTYVHSLCSFHKSRVH